LRQNTLFVLIVSDSERLDNEKSRRRILYLFILKIDLINKGSMSILSFIVVLLIVIAFNTSSKQTQKSIGILFFSVVVLALLNYCSQDGSQYSEETKSFEGHETIFDCKLGFVAPPLIGGLVFAVCLGLSLYYSHHNPDHIIAKKFDAMMEKHIETIIGLGFFWFLGAFVYASAECVG
jgi:cellobiose-specific phosphotransferase system component IIC